LHSDFFAVSESPIVQARVADHFFECIGLLLATADALRNLDRGVVVFQVIEPVGDQFPKIVGLGAPRPGSQGVETGFDFGLQSDRGRHERISPLTTCSLCIQSGWP
jgi:hypothetical protein